MLDFLKRNAQLVIMLLVWTVCGMINQFLAVGVVAASVLLMKQKGFYKELILGFLFILIMGDNRQSGAAYAADAKNIYLVLLSLFYFFDRKNFRLKNTFFVPFIIFFIVGAISLTQAPMANLSNSFQKTLGFVLLLMVIPAYFIKAFEKYKEQFLKDIIYFYAIIFLVGIILVPILPGVVFLVGRYSGIYGNPNGIGIACTLYFLLIAMIQVKVPGLLSKDELRVAYGLIALSVLLAVSRNSMMSIIIYLLFARFYDMSYLAGFTILIVIGIVYQVIEANLVDIVKSLGLGEYLRADNIKDGSGRGLAWAFAWKNIQHQYLMGRGFAYDEWLYFQHRYWLSARGHQGGVHNSWLALWLNTGIIGLTLYAVGFFRTFFKAISKTRKAFAIMFAVLFSATFEAWLMGSLNPFHIMFILLMTIILNDQYITHKEEESAIPVL